MFVKRLLDISLSLFGLIILLPFLIIITILIFLKLGLPVFFIQERLGMNGKIFTLVKFRTMKNYTDSYGNLISDEKRLTNFGRILRSTSIDELPQLINVIKGDMSLVGPRPLLVEYKNLYTEKQYKRHNKPPGLTGWAQINGRNSISWSEKFKLDVWYVDNWSVWLDMKIILITLRKVFKRECINQEGNATVEKFNGFN